MSNNFDLLQRIEKEIPPAAFSNGAGPVPGEPCAVPEPGDVRMSSLTEMDGRSREQMAKLVHFLFGTPDGPRVVVIAGVERGNGGSWMTINCARMLAAEGKGSVCMVDANLLTPVLHKYFAVSNNFGLSDAVRHG